MQRIGPKKEGSAGGKDQVLTVSYFCLDTQSRKASDNSRRYILLPDFR
jgi:hypothetical protein